MSVVCFVGVAVDDCAPVDDFGAIVEDPPKNFVITNHTIPKSAKTPKIIGRNLKGDCFTSFGDATFIAGCSFGG